MLGSKYAGFYLNSVLSMKFFFGREAHCTGIITGGC